MIGTDRCVYETPCRWCSKWDKQCDKKIGCHTNSEPTKNTVSGKSQLCSHCKYFVFDIPQCNHCNVENDFRYFENMFEE